MAVLAAAEDRAVDAAAGDVNLHVLYIRALVVEHTLVALAGAEEVAGQGVINDLFQRARHAHRAVGHRDVGSAVHIGGLAAAVDVGQDVATLDGHVGIAFHPSGSHDISALMLIRVKIGHAARAAAEHVAVVRMAVLGYLGTSIGIVCICRIVIVLAVSRILVFSIRVVGCTGLTVVVPAGALQVRTVVRHGVAVTPYLRRMPPGGVLAAAYLAVALYRHIGVVLHQTVLRAAIDRTLDKRIAADGGRGLRG